MGDSLATVLLAGADELTELAVVADQLGAAGLADVERWQALDRLSQHLDGLAAFLSSVAAAVPDLRLELSGALARLKTAALADRLAGRLAPSLVDSGSLDLFDA